MVIMNFKDMIRYMRELEDIHPFGFEEGLEYVKI